MNIYIEAQEQQKQNKHRKYVPDSDDIKAFSDNILFNGQSQNHNENYIRSRSAN